MFEDLFVYPKVLARHRAGLIPFATAPQPISSVRALISIPSAAGSIMSPWIQRTSTPKSIWR
jgi:hypothetical protein